MAGIGIGRMMHASNDLLHESTDGIVMRQTKSKWNVIIKCVCVWCFSWKTIFSFEFFVPFCQRNTISQFSLSNASWQRLLWKPYNTRCIFCSSLDRIGLMLVSSRCHKVIYIIKKGWNFIHFIYLVNLFLGFVVVGK